MSHTDSQRFRDFAFVAGANALCLMVVAFRPNLAPAARAYVLIAGAVLNVITLAMLFVIKPKISRRLLLFLRGLCVISFGAGLITYAVLLWRLWHPRL
jgi:hypothetical protein